MTNAPSALLPPVEQDQLSQKDKPRWAPFWVTIITVAALTVAPLIITFSAPSRAEGTIGVFQHVQLTAADGGASATIKFVAPEGWIDQTGEAADTRFNAASADGTTRLEASVISGASDATSVLREHAPLGSAGSPIQGILPESTLEVAVIEYDLAAGNTLTQAVAACTQEPPSTCLFITVERPNLSQDGVLPIAVLELIQSAEVQK